MDELITPYCTVNWANQFFSEFGFDSNWNGASEEKKLSAVKAASNFLDLYVTFYDDDNNPVYFTPGSDDDFANIATPAFLKEATAKEAAYLLSLDDNPAEPHPLTILGMISADGKKFDVDMTPPIFPKGVVRVLEKNYAEVDAEATGVSGLQVRTFSHTY
jgi:hypothetical protein